MKVLKALRILFILVIDLLLSIILNQSVNSFSFCSQKKIYTLVNWFLPDLFPLYEFKPYFIVIYEFIFLFIVFIPQRRFYDI